MGMPAVEKNLRSNIEPGMSATRSASFWLNLLALAGVYFLTGKLGLLLAFANENATAVWPPTGLSLAVLVLMGRRLWPGVWLGAFVVNMSTSGSLPASVGIAIGNTLEVVCGAWLVERIAGGRHVFEQARTTFAFILSALPSAVIGATIGVTSLGLVGRTSWEQAPGVWLTWWIGDAVSAVMITPLVVMWAASPLPNLRPRLIEGVLLFGVLSLTAILEFGGLLPPRMAQYGNSFVFMPPLLWAAFRFGQRGAVTASTLLSIIAVWGTVRGFGSFALQNPNDSLLLLQAFLATIAFTSLAVGAVVSERRRSAESLTRSEQQARNQNAQLQGIMQAVPALIWIAHDPECRVITGNPASYELLRMPPGKNASVSDPARDESVAFEVFQDGRKLAAEELPVQRAAAGETIRDFEEEVRFADGTSRHLFGNAAPLPAADGESRGAVAAFVDITERKQAERRLAANLAVAQLLVASPAAGAAMSGVLRTICETLEWSVGAIWTPGPDGRSLRCQDVWHDPSTHVPEFEAVSRQTAFAPGVGLPGRVWQTLEPSWIPDVTQDTNFPRARCAAAEGLHGAFGFPVLSNGRCVAVIEFFSREIREPDRRMLAMFAGLGAQIGQYLERQRAEEALRASQVKLQLVTDCMSAPVVWCSRDLRFRWISKPYADRVRRTPEQLIGHPLIEILGSEMLSRLEPHIKRVLAGETVSFEELSGTGGNGPRWVNAILSPTYDTAGAPDGFVAVLLDIDQRKRAEQALVEADRKKDEFLAILAHELRNPLAPIRYALAVLQRVEPDSPEAEELRGVIDRQVGQMERLLDDLLDVNRITSGKLQLCRERVNLASVMGSAIESTRPLIDMQTHALSVEFPREPIWLDADPLRLAQVLSNLLSNAAKYTEKNGNIQLTAERVGSEALVRVRDSGIGIPDGKLEHIFEMFVQVDNSLERTRGGLGVGLTLVQRLVGMHGGRITVHSDGPGKGSEFTVHLPLSTAATGDGRPPCEPSDVDDSRGKLRIVVADDNADASATLGELLSLQGHQIRLAHDGESALEAVMSFEPDAAFLDIGMPGLNGYEVARRVRGAAGGRRVYLVALTGFGQDDDKRLAHEAGFDAHLTKPARIAAIEGLLANVERSGEC
jgi:PAS domain S-box-containing protein